MSEETTQQDKKKRRSHKIYKLASQKGNYGQTKRTKRTFERTKDARKPTRPRDHICWMKMNQPPSSLKWAIGINGARSFPNRITMMSMIKTHTVTTFEKILQCQFCVFFSSSSFPYDISVVKCIQWWSFFVVAWSTGLEHFILHALLQKMKKKFDSKYRFFQISFLSFAFNTLSFEYFKPASQSASEHHKVCAFFE